MQLGFFVACNYKWPKLVLASKFFSACREPSALVSSSAQRFVGREECRQYEKLNKLSHEKNHPTFHCTGCLIGILIMVYDNPYITG